MIRIASCRDLILTGIAFIDYGTTEKLLVDLEDRHIIPVQLMALRHGKSHV